MAQRYGLTDRAPVPWKVRHHRTIRAFEAVSRVLRPEPGSGAVEPDQEMTPDVAAALSAFMRHAPLEGEASR